MTDNRNRNDGGSPFAFHSSESIRIDPKNRKKHNGNVRHVKQSDRQLATRNSAAFSNMGERQAHSGGARTEHAALSRDERRKRRKEARERRRQERDAERLAQIAGATRQAGEGATGEAAAYVAQLQQKKIHDHRMRVFVSSLVLALVLVPVLTVLPTGVFGGSNAMTPALFFERLGTNISGLASWIAGAPSSSAISIVFLQMLAAGVVGAALSLNGCIYQGALNNALASPSTLGVMSGGTLGTLVYVLTLGVPVSVGSVTAVRASEAQAQFDAMDIGSYILATQTRFIFSLAGCLIVVALILCISHIAGRGKLSKVALLIAGQVFATLITGVETVIRSYVSIYGSVEQQTAITAAIGGSINSVTDWLTLVILVVPLVIGAAIIIFMRGRLNVLAFDPDEAKTMGLSVTATRNFVIIVCTILTGVVVSMVGSIGFVGFIIPHIARRVVGPDFRFLVPVSLTFGAVFLMLCNYLMNMTGILTGALGVFTSLIGAVFFLAIIVKERRAGNVEWV